MRSGLIQASRYYAAERRVARMSSAGRDRPVPAAPHQKVIEVLAIRPPRRNSGIPRTREASMEVPNFNPDRRGGRRFAAASWRMPGALHMLGSHRHCRPPVSWPTPVANMRYDERGPVPVRVEPDPFPLRAPAPRTAGSRVLWRRCAEPAYSGSDPSQAPNALPAPLRIRDPLAEYSARQAAAAPGKCWRPRPDLGSNQCPGGSQPGRRIFDQRCATIRRPSGKSYIAVHVVSTLPRPCPSAGAEPKIRGMNWLSSFDLTWSAGRA